MQGINKDLIYKQVFLNDAKDESQVLNYVIQAIDAYWANDSDATDEIRKLLKLSAEHCPHYLCSIAQLINTYTLWNPITQRDKGLPEAVKKVRLKKWGLERQSLDTGTLKGVSKKHQEELLKIYGPSVGPVYSPEGRKAIPICTRKLSKSIHAKPLVSHGQWADIAISKAWVSKVNG